MRATPPFLWPCGTWLRSPPRWSRRAIAGCRKAIRMCQPARRADAVYQPAASVQAKHLGQRREIAAPVLGDHDQVLDAYAAELWVVETWFDGDHVAHLEGDVDDTDSRELWVPDTQALAR